MEAICIGALILMGLLIIVGIIETYKEKRERLRYEAGEMTWEEAWRYREKMRRQEHQEEEKRQMRAAQARQMRNLGMFFLLGDLADGDLDGSFFFMDGDEP